MSINLTVILFKITCYEPGNILMFIPNIFRGLALFIDKNKKKLICSQNFFCYVLKLFFMIFTNCYINNLKYIL